VLLFRANKAPDFVALQTTNPEIADVLVVVLGTGFAKFNEEFGHSVNGNVCETARRP
jgi:hypothetical protein